MILYLFWVILIVVSLAKGFVEPPYPSWAHSHWVWLSAKTQNQSLLLDIVKQYKSYGIPVGALNVDSGWTTAYNNF